MAAEYEYWSSRKNGKWYWHLLDSDRVIVAEGGGGAGHSSDKACVAEINRMEAILGATKQLVAREVPDPNP